MSYDTRSNFFFADYSVISKYPLHHACKNGDLISLSRLMNDCPCFGVYEEDSCFKWTPMHWASVFGQTDCLKFIAKSISAGPAKYGEVKTSSTQETPLHLAASAGQVDTVEWLINHGCSKTSCDLLRETAVHKAVRAGSLKCLKVLFSHETDNSVLNFQGKSPYDLALSLNFLECAEFIVKRCKLTGVMCSDHEMDYDFHTKVDPFADNNTLFKRKHFDDFIDENSKRVKHNYDDKQVNHQNMSAITLNGFSLANNMILEEAAMSDTCLEKDSSSLQKQCSLEPYQQILALNLQPMNILHNRNVNTVYGAFI